MIGTRSGTRPQAFMVDDDAILRMDAAEILQQDGFETLEARNRTIKSA